jgi:hypothetical protein
MGIISDARQEIFGKDYKPAEGEFELGGYSGDWTEEELEAEIEKLEARAAEIDSAKYPEQYNEAVRKANHARDMLKEVANDFAFDQFEEERARGKEVRDEFMGRADEQLERGRSVADQQRGRGEDLGDFQRDQAVAGMGAAISYGNQQESRGILAQQQLGRVAGGFGEQAFLYDQRSTPELSLHQSGIDEGRQGRALDQLRAFYEQGPGPSLAEAQLEAESQRIASRNLSLARSGRGSGVSAASMRQALDANVDVLGDTNRNAAMLRAQEADAWRGRQLQGMGLEQNTLQSMRGATLAEQQAFVDSQIAGMGLNDQAAANMRGMMLDSIRAGNDAAVNFSGAANTARGTGFNYGATMSGTGNTFESGMAGTGNTFETNATAGSNNQAETAERADQQHRGAGMGALETELNAGIAKEGLKAGVATNAQNANERFGGSMASSTASVIGDAAAASDRATKEDLARTKGELSTALGELRRLGGAEYPVLQQPDTAALDRAQSAADALGDAPAFTYQYTPTAQRRLGSAAPPGRRAGPMADDLKRGPLRDLVFEGPGGTDMVDTKGLTMATAGAVGEQQREIETQQRELDELKALAMGGMDEEIEYPRTRRRRAPAIDFGY